MSCCFVVFSVFGAFAMTYVALSYVGVNKELVKLRECTLHGSVPVKYGDTSVCTGFGV